MASSCPICVEKFSKTSRKSVVCPYPQCEFEACLSCVKSFALQSINDIACMKCRRPWSSEFVDMHLSYTWRYTTYKKHRQLVLMDRERAMLPATQPVVERNIALKKAQEELNALLDEIARLRAVAVDMHRNIQNPDAIKVSNGAVHRVLCGCSKADCKGFVYTNGICGLCDTRICKECREPLTSDSEQDHECNADTLATTKLLSKDSRPCPGCAALVYKIDGCSQMFCTQCHISYDWKTGEQVRNGPLHNPHYYEWLRTSTGREPPREQGDVPPCGAAGGAGRLPEPWTLSRHLQMCGFVTGRVANPAAATNPVRHLDQNGAWLLDMMRQANHLLYVEIPRYRRTQNQGRNQNNARPQDNEDLRVKYLMNELTEEKFKTMLVAREKRRERDTEVYQVLDMYIQATSDMFARILAVEAGPVARQLVLDIKQEMERLTDYTEQSLEKVRTRFKSSLAIEIRPVAKNR